MSNTPKLSVIVTIVDGGETLERCLAGLAGQERAPSMEVLIPWDPTAGDPSGVRARFPQFRVLDTGLIATRRPTGTPAGQHELYDRRRAAGLAQAHGSYIAILEDRGVPRPTWARTMIDLHEVRQAAAIGGAIENGADRLLNWAVYFCDFGRYQGPFEPGAREYVSDVNICYRRDAIDRTREIWKDAYHEPKVHWALQRDGFELWLCPEPVVDQHRLGLRLGKLLAERRDWGRLFAAIRSTEIPSSRRKVLAAGSVVLPAVLFARKLGDAIRKRRTLGSFLKAAPATFLLLTAWSFGELQGYLTGER